MRFFIECTNTFNTKLNTGIQRVVRNIVREALASENDHPAVPVSYLEGQFVEVADNIPFPEIASGSGTLSEVAARLPVNRIKSKIHAAIAFITKVIPFQPFVKFMYAPRSTFGLAGIIYFPMQLARGASRSPKLNELSSATFRSGDVLILLDASWDINLWKAVDALKEQGVSVAVVIYDLIPLTHPQFCTAGLTTAFGSWLEKAVLRADVLIAISDATASELRKNLTKFVRRETRLPQISFFWLGSELDGRTAVDSGVSPDLLAICGSDRPTYVYVSTIEPRKNHRYALEAFEMLWARGITANFVLLGRVGWRSDDFVAGVRSHEQFGKQLFMLNNVDDDGLAYVYSVVHGLIFTSFIEGFGLPVIEGLQQGVPVFASDIPAFREIGKSGVHFVSLESPHFLAEALAEHITLGSHRLAEPVPWMTWGESLRHLELRIRESLSAT